jgi:hypothetical protein
MQPSAGQLAAAGGASGWRQRLHQLYGRWRLAGVSGASILFKCEDIMAAMAQRIGAAGENGESVSFNGVGLKYEMKEAAA